MGDAQANGDIDVDVIVVGAGFGGCYSLHKMRERGFSTKLIEAGSDFGGVWHFNRYPGAKVDSEHPFYQMSLPEVWKDWVFTSRYPTSPELREYFRHIATKLDLRKDAIFNHRIVEAKYITETGKWQLLSDRGLKATCRYVVFAAGTTNKAYTPPFPGLKGYKGQVVHSCAWPEDFDATGKKIALIGQGSSGIQILQELAKEDCQVTVFLRTANPTLPVGEKQNFTKEEAEGQKSDYEDVFTKAKSPDLIGYPYIRGNKLWRDSTPEEREVLYDKLWKDGGMLIVMKAYADIMANKEANKDFYAFFAKKARGRMTDKDKADVVAPLEQQIWMGGKRIPLETDYYEMIDRPNVSLVELRKTPIETFTETGIQVASPDPSKAPSQHDFDVVVFATGYDSVTGSLYDMNISDRNGQTLQNKWSDGIRTFLGMMVPDMPNAFILYGPQAPTSLTNGPPFIEAEVDWVLALMDKMQSDGIQSAVPTEASTDEWVAKNAKMMEYTLTRETPSWWRGDNIPGKKVEPLIWFGGQKSWREACYSALKDWSAFLAE